MATTQIIKTTKPNKKNLIVITAYKLFKENGFYATGVDLIMREAGVSKRTLYKYFRTKNELIVAVVNHYHATYQEHMQCLLEKEVQTARENILSIFDDAKTWFNDTHFHGCLAVNAMGEFAGKDAGIENACIQFKQWEINVFTDLCKQLEVNHPDQLACKLFVLLEGMSSIAQVLHGQYPVNITLMADQIISSHES